MDGVKLIADGIRLEKKITKAGAKGKRQTRRSATHDLTDIEKDNKDIIIDATKTDSSVDRTEEQDSEEESDDTEKGE